LNPWRQVLGPAFFSGLGKDLRFTQKTHFQAFSTFFMTRHTKLEQEVMALAEPICAVHGVELVDVRSLSAPKATTYRVVIDRERPADDPKPGSAICVTDCQNVSRDLSTAMDVHEEMFASVEYRLEVSSPGIERPLVRLGDFEKFTGREAKIKTFGPVDGRKSFAGRLLGVEGDAVSLEIDGKTLSIPHESIAKANLVHRFER
jgi:ribosome maturation factor RimP